ncbi:FAD-dependent oxidoreductase [Rhizobium sp. FKL33]|uniref:NAD(P)/FAD-dependent oxidoreductase n=1 Tax=Rhizobium sp. FKL33 TaxID=2562307 RepID=UPI0010C0CA0E|nr:FAD-dependent oxidoreductase [Rhizobium sp. FKL33]
MKTAIVLGAGMVGVATALDLQDRGFKVTLVDRRPPGRETSFGNAGIIQSESVEPYAMPRGIRELFDIATGRSNDVVYALRELPGHLGPLLRYWWHSEKGRHRAISTSYASLIAQAAGTHDQLIRRAGADNLIQRSGYRTLYRSTAKFEEGLRKAEEIRAAFGTKFRALTADETLAEEPGLTSAGAGAIHWAEPWTVASPGDLVSAYAALFEREGGTFVEASVEELRQSVSGEEWLVRTSAGLLNARHVVIALGVWASGALKPLGLNFPMVLKRGYHAHYASPRPLGHTTMDTENGYVLAPMRAGTRITTGAHLTLPGKPPVYRQLERAERAAGELMALGDRVEDTPWSGTRPCMPDMLPVIGPAPRHRNLWLNFGHGHQGFTLGPASAKLLGALIEGVRPAVEPSPFRADR